MKVLLDKVLILVSTNALVIVVKVLSNKSVDRSRMIKKISSP